jgi:hypothetical protein
MNVKTMTPEELAAHLHIWVDARNGPAFDELLARLRSERAAREWGAEASFSDGDTEQSGKSLLAAMDAARKDKS